MTVTQRLYEAAKPIWQACHDHPFVQGIGDGTLDQEKFRYFLLQDYLYLFDYAKVFAWGVVKAKDPELMRFFSANVDAILGGEMKTHRAYMSKLGITEEQVFQVKPALPNLSYTSYMLAVAAAGGPAEIVASILACSCGAIPVRSTSKPTTLWWSGWMLWLRIAARRSTGGWRTSSWPAAGTSLASGRWHGGWNRERPGISRGVLPVSLGGL